VSQKLVNSHWNAFPLSALFRNFRIINWMSSKEPFFYSYNNNNNNKVSRDSSVGIATRYGLQGPVIESRWVRHFPHQSRPAPRPTHPPLQRVSGIPGGKSGRGMALTIHPRGSTVVKVLCYKSEGHWFDPRWCHRNFSLT